MPDLPPQDNRSAVEPERSGHTDIGRGVGKRYRLSAQIGEGSAARVYLAAALTLAAAAA